MGRLTLSYRSEEGARFRVRVRPNPNGPGWELVKERRIGDTWRQVSCERVSDVYVDTEDRVLL